MYISIIIFGAIFSMIGFCTAEIANIDLHPMWQFLPIDQCGYGSLSDRIVGGKEATLGQFPWIARIGYKTKRTGTKIVYLCAGSLINPRKHVRFGENFIKSSRDCEDGFCAPPVQDIAVAAIIRHKNSFSEPSLTYGDIALIRLAQPVKYNDFVLPICLPRGEVVRHIQDYLSNGTLLEVAGWGSINPKKTVIPNKLMSVGLPVVNIKVKVKTHVWATLVDL
ncbi:hypothetical protein ABEB36_002329 [Hypothenemus hampei]|uniref:Peptidase S1 domain-containing protein n=1 Tax=Hypothenemus hampei TaxID=57062 RepID=A0ABD1F5R5_HYPHA